MGTKNVGSVFRNPANDHAARLIEEAGLKGRQIGRLRFSPKHANFIENLGGAYIVGTELKLTLALIIIVSVLTVKPSGLLGRTVQSRV